MQLNILLDGGVPVVSLIAPVVSESLSHPLSEVCLPIRLHVGLSQAGGEHYGTDDFFEFLNGAGAREEAVTAWHERSQLLLHSLDGVLSRFRLYLQVGFFEIEDFNCLEKVEDGAFKNVDFFLEILVLLFTSSHSCIDVDLTVLAFVVVFLKAILQQLHLLLQFNYLFFIIPRLAAVSVFNFTHLNILS